MWPRRYEPTNHRRNVIIPNYTIPFRSHKRRPLGIAYAEFSTPEQAHEVVSKLNGQEYRNRKISAQIHEPYDPTTRKTDVQLSQEYLWIPKVSRDVDDHAVRDFFGAYSPKEVYIFNEAVTRGQRWLASRRSNSVLVRLESDQSLEDVIGALKGKRLGKLVVEIKPASESKVKVVIRKAQEAKEKAALKTEPEAVNEKPKEEENESSTKEAVEPRPDHTLVLSVQSPEPLTSTGINVAPKSAATEPVVTQD